MHDATAPLRWALEWTLPEPLTVADPETFNNALFSGDSPVILNAVDSDWRGFAEPLASSLCENPHPLRRWY